MLSIRTAAVESRARICRVATRPLVPGIAQSMTMTAGLSEAARAIASSPLLASPTTSIDGSSSSIRRNPRRTRLWSSASRTVILSAMRNRHAKANDGSPFLGTVELERASDQFGALAHRDQAQPTAGGRAAESFSMVFDFELQGIGCEAQAHPRLLRPGMPRDVVQGFLQHAVDMNGHGAVDGRRRTRTFIRYGNTQLPLQRGEIPFDGVFEPGLLENRGVERLRQAPARCRASSG